jgi:hypothetical protein
MTEQVEKLYKLALDARRHIRPGSRGVGTSPYLQSRMQHYLEADCGCIAALTGDSILSVRKEVERRYNASQ